MSKQQSSADSEQTSFQKRVHGWMMDCFSMDICRDRQERNHRFLEEALELVQACGCTASEAHQLVDYVYGRDQGDINQEVGGVMVTLAALCLANDIDMHQGGEIELARILQPAIMNKIRAKQAAKPKHSPLPAHPAPGAGAEPQTAPSDIERAFRDACDEAGCAYDNEALLEAIHALKERCQADSSPQTAGAESHSPAAMEGEKDTIVNLIHEHVGFEVLLAIESGVLTGVEDAAEAILAELGRRSQAESASVREVELEEALKNLMGIYDTPVSRRRYPQDQFMKEALDIARAALTRPKCEGK